jgi:hypothetical protein
VAKPATAEEISMIATLATKKLKTTACVATAVRKMTTMIFGWAWKITSSEKEKPMPGDRIPIGDVLILRDGLRNIVEDADKLLANRKQARLLMRLLDELLEYREKETGDGSGR